MDGLGLIFVYAIFGSLAVVAIVAFVWLAGGLLLSSFTGFFLQPALWIVRSLRGKR